jgi:hypothetical protein
MDEAKGKIIVVDKEFLGKRRDLLGEPVRRIMAAAADTGIQLFRRQTACCST